MGEQLSHELTMQLIARAQGGDQHASNELVKNNIALVKSIVKRFLNRGSEYDDLCQLGCIGLIKAINNFSTEYKVRFSTYAVPLITGEIRRYLRDSGMIKVSRTLKELAYKAARMQEELTLSNGREPTINEIAKALGVEPEEIVAAQEACTSCASLDEPVYDDDRDLKDTIVGSSDCEGVVDKLLLKSLITNLEPRDRQLIILRYFQDKTQSQTAQILNISQVQVSRLESRIISKMRTSFT